MAKYRLSNEAKEDLIRIYLYGYRQFGALQADKYYNSLFNSFEIIAQRPLSYESVDFLRKGYRRCVHESDSIFFRINGDYIEIMAIVGRQDLESLI